MIKKGNPWNFERTLLLGVSFKLLYIHKSSIFLDSMFTFLHLSFQLGFKTTGLVYLFIVTFRLLSLREANFQLYPRQHWLEASLCMQKERGCHMRW